jgi:prepilin-type processing-associated H-X9-DG protein
MAVEVELNPNNVYDLDVDDPDGTVYAGSTYWSPSANGCNHVHIQGAAPDSGPKTLMMTGRLGSRTKSTSSRWYPKGSSSNPEIEGRHFAGSNYLLADGHVKWYKGEQVSSGSSATAPTNAQNTGDDNSDGCRAAGTQSMKDSTGNITFAITFSHR